MLVEVEKEVKKLIKTYGLRRILEDFDISMEEVIQILEDHGYINLDMYKDEE